MRTIGPFFAHSTQKIASDVLGLALTAAPPARKRCVMNLDGFRLRRPHCVSSSFVDSRRAHKIWAPIHYHFNEQEGNVSINLRSKGHF